MEKPDSVASNPVKSRKWDELTAGRTFRQSDVPLLELLCQWHAVMAKCMEDLDYDGEINVAYQNNLGDIKAMPQLAVMKQASAEIRAISKQLGIEEERPEAVRTPLHVIQANRQARATNTDRAV